VSKRSFRTFDISDKDPDDNLLLDCAQAARAEYLKHIPGTRRDRGRTRATGSLRSELFRHGNGSLMPAAKLPERAHAA